MGRTDRLERAAGTVTAESCGDGVRTLRLLGEHDLSTRDELLGLGEAAVEQGDLVIDLAEVEFIEASIVGAVVELRARALHAGRSCTLVLPRGGLPRRVLELCEVPATVPCTDRPRPR
ncbi:MAG: STAS domain-containing protein [Thermoleophilia bacterium]